MTSDIERWCTDLITDFTKKRDALTEGLLNDATRLIDIDKLRSECFLSGGWIAAQCHHILNAFGNRLIKPAEKFVPCRTDAGKVRHCGAAKVGLNFPAPL